MEELLKYFPNLSDEQIAQFEQLKPLYIDWNEKINVISRKDIDELYTKHVIHSLGIAKVMNFSDDSKVLDIGTGGGFPGIPLAIMFPEVQFHLVDSIQKKILVVEEVKNALGLKNVVAEANRAEKIKGKYDFIVSRAVTQMPKFAQWIRGKFSSNHQNDLPNGVLYLKGGDLSEELADFPEHKAYLLSDYFKEPFFETKKVIYLPANRFLK